MTEGLIALREPAAARVWRLVMDHNPFYLLSAAFMMIGCLTLANSESYVPIPDRRLLGLIATLNAYELLLIGLGIWLIRWRGLIRDGAILLAIEAAFMVDAAMLNAELFTTDFRIGFLVNLLLLMLAAVKLAVIFRGLGIHSVGIYALMVGFVAVLFELPGVFNHLSHHDAGRLSPLAIYGAWWLVGALLVASSYALTALKRMPYRRLILTYVAFALGSLLLHLRLTNWVYNVDWDWANLGPLFLGAAIFVGMNVTSWWKPLTRLQAQLVFPLVALWLSWLASDQLEFVWLGLHWSPMRLTGLGVAAVYMHGLLTRRHPLFAIGTAACLLGALLGGSPGRIWDNLTRIWNAIDFGVEHALPETSLGWGILSIVVAFLLLGVGVVVSMMKAPPVEPPRDAPRPPPPLDPTESLPMAGLAVPPLPEGG